MASNLNIIFVIHTPYHLMVSCVYAEYLHSKYKLDPTFIIIGEKEMSVNQTYIQQIQLPYKNARKKMWRVWKRVYYGGRLFRFSKLFKQIDYKKRTVLFCFYDPDPIVCKMASVIKRKSQDNKIVLVDEGVGMYSQLGAIKPSFNCFLRKCFNVVVGSIKSLPVIGYNKFIDYAIAGDDICYGALEKAQKQIVLKQSKKRLFFDYGKIIEKDFQFSSLQEIRTCEFVYLGQTIMGHGMFEQCEYEFINHLFEMVSQDKTIFIKPHPQEPNGKYDVLVSNKKNLIVNAIYDAIPFEVLISMMYEPKLIMSFHSSAMVNVINLFPHTYFVFLYKMEGAKEIIADLSRSGEIINDSLFHGKYNNVFVPTTDDEFNKIVSERLNDTNLLLDEDKEIQNLDTYPEIDTIINKII